MWWALQRRTIYLGIFFIVLLIIFSPSIYRFLSKEATCSDGKRNGSELGIDCGGECEKVCRFSVEDPLILWSRSFEVRPGVYNSIAMIENLNSGAGAIDIPYNFKLFDSRNVLVYERKGVVDIPAQTRFPVFESAIITGERIPLRTFFEFNLDTIGWLRQESPSLKLKTAEQKITGIESSPKIEVRVENRGLDTAQNIELFIIVYDLVDNAIAGSKTFIEEIKPGSSKLVTFTWPEPFAFPVGRLEIIPKFNTRR